MNLDKFPALLLGMSLVLAGCGDRAPAGDAISSAPAAEAAATGAPPAAATEAPPGFDLASVPVSDQPLGAFPYFSPPEGYAFGNDQQTRDFDRFPFWVEDHFEWVEGKTFTASLDVVPGKQFSDHELRKNIEHVLLAAGGVKVSESPRIPYEATESFSQEIRIGHASGLGSIYDSPVTTYLIRRQDQDIWVHFCASGDIAGVVIAATAPFEATATLLPADQLKQQLDSAGKVEVQVNFATDKADILPDSQPQVDQVLQLLQADPALKLAINGHTDNSGDAARNQALSEQRAQAVVAALTAQGIDASRLQASGFGASQPIADNSNAAGKASNRRVELVKR